MKHKVVLNAAQSARHVQVAWQPNACAILNNTPWSLLMREGSQERPTPDRYDYLVPPGTSTVLPVIAHEFSFALDNQHPHSVAYGQPCTILLLSADEHAPEFGSSTYRSAIHENFTLSTPDNPYELVLDTRSARAIYMSLDARASAFGEQWLAPANGYVMVHPSVNPIINETYHTASRIIMLPRPTPRVEAIVPLASNYTKLSVVQVIEEPITITCSLDIAILDAVPSYALHKISDYRFSEFELPSTSSGHILLEYVYAGYLPYLEIAIEPATPDADFDLMFYMHSGSTMQYSEVWRRRLSNSEMVTIAYGGPNALPTRAHEEFLGRDVTTGALAWRFPLRLYFDRFIRLVCDNLSSTTVNVHVGLHYVMEI